MKGPGGPGFAGLIHGTCKMNGVEPYAYLCDLFTRLTNGHLAKSIDALMPWSFCRPSRPHNELVRYSSVSSFDRGDRPRIAAIEKSMGREHRIRRERN